MRESGDEWALRAGPVEVEIVGFAGRLGRELIDEFATELAGLADFLSALADAPVLEPLQANLASVTYRLCEVYKTLTLLGYAAWAAACECRSASVTPQAAEFALVQVRLSALAEGIERLVAGTTVFLGPDLELIMRQPEIAHEQGFHDATSLIWTHMQQVFARVEDIAVTAARYGLADPQQPLAAIAVVLDAGDIPLRNWQAVHDSISSHIESALRRPIKRTAVTNSLLPCLHPHPDDAGHQVVISAPTRETSAMTWIDSARTAVFIPAGKIPGIINTVPVAPWVARPVTTAQWNVLDLLMPELVEPPIPVSGLAIASGAVVIEPDGRLWLVSPTNRFGGYKTTFPKGKRDDKKMRLQANAVKECFEESGLKVRIIGLLGDFKRSTSVTRFYLAKRVGGDPTDMGWESQAVHLVPPAHWDALLTNPSDRPVLAALQAYLKSIS